MVLKFEISDRIASVDLEVAFEGGVFGWDAWVGG